MRLGRPCIRCGRKTTTGNYCTDHRPVRDTAARDARQPYRAAYNTPEYRRARRERFRLAGGRCEHVDARGRCQRLATEAHHVIPLSRAGADLAAALALCSVENLRAVCFEHNPRGRRPWGV